MPRIIPLSNEAGSHIESCELLIDDHPSDSNLALFTLRYPDLSGIKIIYTPPPNQVNPTSTNINLNDTFNIATQEDDGTTIESQSIFLGIGSKPLANERKEIDIDFYEFPAELTNKDGSPDNEPLTASNYVAKKDAATARKPKKIIYTHPDTSTATISNWLILLLIIIALVILIIFFS
jgi:hypothetical protein